VCMMIRTIDNASGIHSKQTKMNAN